MRRAHPSAPRLLSEWLHSFRMPLFFLIAGFFGRMMLTRYGTAGFLGRRWRRIGLPLMIGVLTFSPITTQTLDLVKRPPAYSTGRLARRGRPAMRCRPPTGRRPAPRRLRTPPARTPSLPAGRSPGGSSGRSPGSSTSTTSGSSGTC